MYVQGQLEKLHKQQFPLSPKRKIFYWICSNKIWTNLDQVLIGF